MSGNTGSTPRYEATAAATEAGPFFHHKGLVDLGLYLRQSGYQHVAVTPLTHSYNNERSANGLARNLRDVLGWSRLFERTSVSEREFELMLNAGVLTPEGRYWRCHVRWATLGQLLCVHSAYPTDAEDAVFFGPDTYRFARVIQEHLNPLSTQATQPHKITRAADLGCGSGVGALLVTQACPSAQVLGVDINSLALQMTEINAELAGTTQVRPVHSNLLDDVEGQFDLITANPPYLLDASERTYRHGGGQLGEELSKRIVATALDRLAPGGTLLLYTGVAIVDGKDPFRVLLEEWLGDHSCRWSYDEVDPDVFAEELLKPAYAQVERIAAVCLTLTKGNA